MNPLPDAQPLTEHSTQSATWPMLAWLTVALTGFAAPIAAMFLLADTLAPAPSPSVVGSILAVSLMGAGIIAAAASARFGVGLALALLAGAGLILLAQMLGMPALPHPLWAALAVSIASLSFAARGALFARSAGGRGWWIAVFVVAGEAAILLTALVRPGELPEWLLVLLPAQWTSTAVQVALFGTGAHMASAALIALAGTAAATLLVASLWPRRWPYLIMFSTWLALSALVWHWPAPPVPHTDVVVSVEV
ncbi:MAG: hypothetical protein AAFW59_01810 [Pseudomonadota bacterium]